MSYFVMIDWDEQYAVPFGTLYTSKPFVNKRDTWSYVQHVKEHALVAKVQLHNILVWCTNGDSYKCVWCWDDPRKYGDPWPTWK